MLDDVCEVGTLEVVNSVITKRRSRTRLDRRRQLQHRKKDPKRSREFLLRDDNKENVC